MSEIKMKVYRSKLSHYNAQSLAAALQSHNQPPQRITVKRVGEGNYTVLVGGKYASLWTSGKLPSKSDIEFRIWRE